MNLNNVQPKWVKDQYPYVLMIISYLRTITLMYIQAWRKFLKLILHG